MGDDVSEGRLAFYCFAALALIAWDGVLHVVDILFTDENQNLLVPLPWILWPEFPTWRMYDLFWAIVHFSAFGVLAMDQFLANRDKIHPNANVKKLLTLLHT